MCVCKACHTQAATAPIDLDFSSFVCVDGLPLDPEILEDVKQQLEFNLDDIKKRYASFVSCIFNHIYDKEVNMEKLRIYLLGLPAMECSGHSEKFKLLSGVKHQLMKASIFLKCYLKNVALL